MQLHVLLDREKLTAMNLTVAQIVAKIQENNLKLPAGHILERDRETAITFDSEFHNIRELGEFEIGVVGGHKVYLGDIAEIKLMAKEIRQEGYLGAKPGVAIEIVKKNGLLYSPGKASNAGGVATSALEMTQNSERLSWSFEEVDSKLHGIMKNIYASISEMAKEYGETDNFMLGANIAGFRKVADAMLAQGVV